MSLPGWRQLLRVNATLVVVGITMATVLIGCLTWLHWVTWTYLLSWEKDYVWIAGFIVIPLVAFLAEVYLMYNERLAYRLQMEVLCDIVSRSPNNAEALAEVERTRRLLRSYFSLSSS